MTLRTTDPVPSAVASDNCLGRTCLKWGSDGELTPLDVQIVIQKLRLVDTEFDSPDPEA